jgi:hypothetical protein
MSKCGEIRSDGLFVGEYVYCSRYYGATIVGPTVPHKVTLLGQVAKDRPVNVVLALSKDHT